MSEDELHQKKNRVSKENAALAPERSRRSFDILNDESSEAVFAVMTEPHGKQNSADNIDDVQGVEASPVQQGIKSQSVPTNVDDEPSLDQARDEQDPYEGYEITPEDFEVDVSGTEIRDPELSQNLHGLGISKTFSSENVANDESSDASFTYEPHEEQNTAENVNGIQEIEASPIQEIMPSNEQHSVNQETEQHEHDPYKGYESTPNDFEPETVTESDDQEYPQNRRSLRTSKIFFSENVSILNHENSDADFAALTESVEDESLEKQNPAENVGDVQKVETSPVEQEIIPSNVPTNDHDEVSVNQESAQHDPYEGYEITPNDLDNKGADAKSKDQEHSQNPDTSRISETFFTKNIAPLNDENSDAKLAALMHHPMEYEAQIPVEDLDVEEVETKPIKQEKTASNALQTVTTNVLDQVSLNQDREEHDPYAGYEITPEDLFNEIKVARTETIDQEHSQNLHSFVISKTFSSENVVVLLNLRRMNDGEWVLDKTIAQGLKPQTYGGVVSIDQYDFVDQKKEQELSEEQPRSLKQSPSKTESEATTTIIEPGNVCAGNKNIMDILQKLENYVAEVNREIQAAREILKKFPQCPDGDSEDADATCEPPQFNELPFLDKLVKMFTVLLADEDDPNCDLTLTDNLETSFETQSAISFWLRSIMQEISSYCPAMILPKAINDLRHITSSTATIISQSNIMLDEVKKSGLLAKLSHTGLLGVTNSITSNLTGLSLTAKVETPPPSPSSNRSRSGSGNSGNEAGGELSPSNHQEPGQSNQDYMDTDASAKTPPES